MSVSGQPQEFRCNVAYPHALSLVILDNNVDGLFNLAED